MSDYHEPANELSEETRNFTRALKSLKEEIEAIEWYTQRAELTRNESLKRIVSHNRDEEIEHACMTIEWLRRYMPGWDEELRNCLYKEGDIAAEDHHQQEAPDPGSNKQEDLGIGQIK